MFGLFKKEDKDLYELNESLEKLMLENEENFDLKRYSDVFVKEHIIEYARGYYDKYQGDFEISKNFLFNLDNWLIRLARYEVKDEYKMIYLLKISAYLNELIRKENTQFNNAIIDLEENYNRLEIDGKFLDLYKLVLNMVDNQSDGVENLYQEIINNDYQKYLISPKEKKFFSNQCKVIDNYKDQIKELLNKYHNNIGKNKTEEELEKILENYCLDLISKYQMDLGYYERNFRLIKCIDYVVFDLNEHNNKNDFINEEFKKDMISFIMENAFDSGLVSSQYDLTIRKRNW